MFHVLIVDDEPKMGKVLTAMLAGESYAVETATRGLAAIELLRQKPFDVVLCDLRMPDIDGLTVLTQAKALRPEIDFVMMTAFATVGTAVQAMKDGAYDYLIKPFDMEELRLLLRKIVERRTLIATNQELQRRLDSASGAGFSGLVGRSAKMREVYQLIGQVAPRDTTVLVRGESGTGKELVARAIHSQSARSGGPLVDVHCGAIPETLLESELFGYEKGAFTGANDRKEGRFELAEGGSIFLDEVAEMSTGLQVKLLRFLQDKEFVRIGGTRRLKVDTRVIAATNRDLEAAIRETRFRDDLFYRLNVFPIVLPPLRTHKEDIPELVQLFLQRHGLSMESVSPEVPDLLGAYDWPGNVRELENAIERAVIVAAGRAITASAFPPEVRSRPATAPVSPPPTTLAAPAPVAEPAAAPASMDERELQMIREAIEKAGGNKTIAAKALGITRRRLYSRLKSLEGRGLGGG